MLISPASLREPDGAGRRLPASLTRAKVEAAPDIDAHRTISRQHEVAFATYYGVPCCWAGPSLSVRRRAASRPVDMTAEVERERLAGQEPGDAADAHLHDTDEVAGYGLHALDGDLGHVDDFLVDVGPWTIRYLAVDTRNWWPGNHVLVAPDRIRGVSWEDGTVAVALTRDAIRNAPEYDPARPVDREYEAALYAYHGRPRYWGERAA